MSTHLFPVSAYPPVQQNPIPTESSDKWSLAVPLGIIAVTVLFMIYRMLVSEDSSPSKGSFDGKVVSTDAPIEAERVLCIIRIFRTALEKNPGYDLIPVQVEMNAETRGQRLDLREDIVLPQGDELVDIASLLPINQKVWLEITSKGGRIFQSLEVRRNPTLYQITKTPTKITKIELNPLKKPAYSVPEYESNTQYIPLSSFAEHPPITLQQEQQSLPKKKIVISESQQMTLDEEYKGDSLMFENHSDRSVIVQVELKHRTNDSFLLFYSVKPHKIVTHSPKFSRYVNQPPKPVTVPLDQIIKDYQAAYKIKHRKELSNPQQEDFSIVSINYVSYISE